MRRLPDRRCRPGRRSSLLGAVGCAGRAGAQRPRPTAAAADGDRVGSSVVKVSGLLDPVLVDFVEHARSTDAEPTDAVGPRPADRTAPASVVADAGSPSLARAGSTTRRCRSTCGSVPSGSRPPAAAAQLVGVADRSAWRPAPGSATHRRPRASPTDRCAGVRRRCRRHRRAHGRRRGGLDARIATSTAPTIGDFIIEPARRRDQRGQPGRRAPASSRVTQVRSASCSLQVAAVPHRRQPAGRPTCCSSIGLALIVFELFTAGVGVAGVVGAGCFILGVLRPRRPAREPGGRSRCSCCRWSASPSTCRPACPASGRGIGVVLFVVGSLTLYDGLSLSWITLLVAHRRHRRSPSSPACRRWSAPASRRRPSGGSGWSARWARRSRRSPPTASSSVRGALVAGPHQPGHADRRLATRCGWSASTASCSRSSPRRAAPATTAETVGRSRTAPDGRRAPAR